MSSLLSPAFTDEISQCGHPYIVKSHDLPTVGVPNNEASRASHGLGDSLNDHRPYTPNGYFHDSGCSSDTSTVEGDGFEPIAVIGLSLRFPQDATSPEAFWQMLIEGRSALTDVPKERFNLDAFYRPDSNRTGVV